MLWTRSTETVMQVQALDSASIYTSTFKLLGP